MINEHDAKILSDTIKLLQATARDLLYFYEEWWELFAERKTLMENLQVGSDNLRYNIIAAMKQVNSFDEFREEFEIAKKIGRWVVDMSKLIDGPNKMSKAALDIAKILQQALDCQKQLDEALTPVLADLDSESEEDRILSLLTEDELAQVYKWIEGR